MQFKASELSILSKAGKCFLTADAFGTGQPVSKLLNKNKVRSLFSVRELTQPDLPHDVNALIFFPPIRHQTNGCRMKSQEISNESQSVFDSSRHESTMSLTNGSRSSFWIIG